MKNKLRQHSYFELVVIAALIMLASWQAWHLSFAGTLTLFHAIFLIAGYLSLRLLVARLNPWAGKLVFAIACVLLISDLAASWLSGMHLNIFILSLTIQPGFSDAIGLSPIILLFGISSAILAALLLAKKFTNPTFTMQGRVIAGAALAALLFSQTTFAWQFFRGNAEIEEVRRELPFFASVHPYRIRKIAGILFSEPMQENPFGISISRPASTGISKEPDAAIGHSENILLIVADSLRAQDLIEDIQLMPNLRKLSQRGTLNLNHYSTSNCTHFSFYSMFTGRLPTSFGAARRGQSSGSLLQTLAGAGYQLSTAEASTLDWYETSDIIFPRATQRFIATAEEQSQKDREVTDKTISVLEKKRDSISPFFHLTYYYGPHYPYDPAITSAENSSKDRYLATLHALDQELGRLVAYFEDASTFEDTIIVFTSDHGEELLQDSGLTGHGSSLNPAQTQVPFLVINETETTLPLKARSHTEIKEMLLAAPPPQEQTPVVLANCGYDYPRGFAVVYGNDKYRFDTTGGYLSPIYTDKPNEHEKQMMSDAALDLIKILRDN